MRCSVYKCVNNDHGYCYDKDFVSINDEGKCNLMHLRPEQPAIYIRRIFPDETEDKNGRS